MLRNVRPIVVPTYDAVAAFRVMTMRLEAAGSVLKFDPDPFLRVTAVTISNAVREGGTDFFDSELKPLCEVRE